MKYYTLEDFNIIKREPVEELESETDQKNPIFIELEKILEKLSNDLGVSTTEVVISRPNPSRSRNRNYGNGHGHGHGQRQDRYNKSSEESWIQPKIAFKTTTIEKSKTSAINEIRTCLNKLSTKNYETSKNTLLEIIKKSQDTQMQEVAQHIFDIASTNKFFSEIYADIYKALLTEFDEHNKTEDEDEDYEFIVDSTKNTNIFRTLLETFLSKFTETMHTIKYVDAAENYDNFCEYNKLNDKRKATSLFIVNLTKKGVIEPRVFVSIVSKILDILQGYMHESGKTNEVEEITENLFLFLTSNVDLNGDCDDVKSIRDQITLLAKLKVKDRVSLSSRAIFKYCDIVEKCNVKM